MNTQTAAHHIVEQSKKDPPTRAQWLKDSGVLAALVRFDAPIDETLVASLAKLHNEIPDIIDHIRRETDDTRRLLVAQIELKLLRQKIGWQVQAGRKPRS